jgi:hypothetical protein
MAVGAGIKMFKNMTLYFRWLRGQHRLPSVATSFALFIVFVSSRSIYQLDINLLSHTKHWIQHDCSSTSLLSKFVWKGEVMY